MWILSRYILREHIGPFFFAFFIITFTLIVDFLPQVVELIIGRDISTWTVIKLFTLNLAWMLALSLPMAVLVSTLMAFGRLTADSEILAMKSSGVNLVRALMLTCLAGLLLAIFLVWFNNEVLPRANHSASTLRGDIRRMKPTFELRSGVFINYIPGYVILCDEVDYKTSQIRGVVIYDQKDPQTAKTITADSGTIHFSAQGETIRFDLVNGQVYEQDLQKESSFRISTFRAQTFTVDNLGTRLEETDRSYRGDREMSAADMMIKTDVWRTEINNYHKMIITDTDSAIAMLMTAPQLSGWDSTRTETQNLKMAAGNAYSSNLKLSRQLKTRRGQIRNNTRLISKYLVEIHKKYSLPAAALVFILIGAPLGIISRRGGLAISVGVSIGLFTLYWAFLIGGEQLADRLILPPAVAMWAANVLLGALGILLLYKVKSEKSVADIFTGIFWRRVDR